MRLSDGEFADYVVCFLYDKLTKPQSVVPAEVNPGFNAFAEILMKRGFKSQLLYRYMKMPTSTRSKYRTTSGVYNQKAGTSSTSIVVFKTKIKKDVKKIDTVKDIIKKISALGLTFKTVKGIIDIYRKRKGGK
jgi:hypothetical protein